MSAGDCPRCNGFGHHPSKISPTWSVTCGLCNGTGSLDPSPVSLWAVAVGFVVVGLAIAVWIIFGGVV